MNLRTLRLLAAPVLALSLAATLTGCSSVLDSVLGDTAEPAQRDEPGGEITASAQADVFTLQVGDCLDYASQSAESTEFTSLPTIPCDQQHDTEIYAETTLTEEQYKEALAASTDTETLTFADQFCYDAFAPFVGTSYEESALEFTLLSPTDESWAQGDDVLQCLVVHLDGGLTGTMRGSAL